MKKCTDCKFIFIRPGRANWCEKYDKYIYEEENDTAEFCEEYEED